MTLKQKTVSGLLWSFIDSFANQGIQFILGIILARILSPREFGLIGMITIFIAVSQTFIDSGFSNALIRKKDCSQVDYSTVFIFNIIVSVFFALLLILFGGLISDFFNEPQLESLVQVLALGLCINAFSIIQKIILTKRIDFKKQAKVTIVASLGSGTIAIAMALTGYGVWSLVALTLSRNLLNSFFLWIWAKWKPIWAFSKKSFQELFGFGSKLLISGLIDTVYRNIYYLIIGKFFSASELGFYTRADQFKNLPSANLNGIISRVSYPVLSSIQDEPERLKASYRILVKSTMLLTFVLMLGMAAIAEPLIVTLIGEKWQPSVIYLQLLCPVGMLYPLHALNLNILKVKGRSDLFLKLEIIKKTIAVPVIIIGILFGIKIMIVGMFVNSLISYYLNSYYSGKLINYSITKQIQDILPSFFLAVIVSGLVYLLGIIITAAPVVLLTFQIFAGALLVVGFCEFFKFSDYFYLKQIVLGKLFSR